MDVASVGEFLRCSMGLSAWKQFGTSRWALRVNPSSGNLHPTEAYVVWEGRVCHYAPREHLLEERCVLAGSKEPGPASVRRPGPSFWTRRDAFLVALTSIPWREAWKYGERAFRYCLHDVGHAIAALRLAAALLGWRLRLLPQWSDAQLATLLGVDRDEDYGDAEREEPECLAVVATADPSSWWGIDPVPPVDAAKHAEWQGRANQLSAGRVDWPIIDEAIRATRSPGKPGSPGSGIGDPGSGMRDRGSGIVDPESRLSARHVILRRRSALAFDPTTGLRRDVFFSMLRRLHPLPLNASARQTPAPPWDAIEWPPQVHLAMFVHRVEGITPGVYACLRDSTVLNEWKAAMRPDFLWERLNDPNDSNDSNAGLFLLLPIDCRRAANRVSCNQDIAEDGFFSFGMIARFESALRKHGEWWYRRLFWECGMIGQVLYLEAEAAGARATGIGCFYDDPVHELLGFRGREWQSLYHFSMGMAIEDTRLTTESGYTWESGG